VRTAPTLTPELRKGPRRSALTENQAILANAANLAGLGDGGEGFSPSQKGVALTS